MATKFSQFNNNGEIRVTSQIVGLSISGQNARFDFPGTGIKDEYGSYLLRWLSPTGSPGVNYLTFYSSDSGISPSIASVGNDANVNLLLQTQGSGNILLMPNGTGITQIVSSTSLVVPSGNTGQRPAGTAGAVRYNTDLNYLEYYQASTTSWVTLATGTSAVSEVLGTAGQIDVTSGTMPVVSIDLGYVGQTSITTLGTVGTGTWHGSTVTVPYGGTGAASFTSYSLITSNTTSTGALAPLAAGTSGQVLVSQGAGAYPAWQNVSSVGIASVVGTAPITATTVSGVATIGLTSPLAVSYGGTNQTSFLVNSLVCSNSSGNALISLLAGSSGQVLVSNGTSAAPSWASLSSIGITSVVGTAPISVSTTSGVATVSLATPLTGTYGGTGVNNGSNLLTVNGSSAINQSVTQASSPVFAGGVNNSGFVIGSAVNNGNIAVPGNSFSSPQSFAPLSPTGNPLFGVVALSPNSLVLAIGGPDNNSDIGAVWVYTRTSVGKLWSYAQTLTVTPISSPGSFGQSVAISYDGSTIAAGAPDDNGNIGCAYIFTLSGSTWSQQAKLVGTGNTGSSQQGWGLDLSSDGNTVAIGGPYDSSSTGAVWVFTRSGTTWTQYGSKITATGLTGSTNLFGFSLSLAAAAIPPMLVVGAYGDNSNTGAAIVFYNNGSAWTQSQKLTSGSGSWFGCALQLTYDGNTLLIGASRDSSSVGAFYGAGKGSGQTTYGTLSKYTASGSFSYVGASVAVDRINGVFAAIGAPNTSGTVGAAITYNNSATGSLGSASWAQGSTLVGTGYTGTPAQGSFVSVDSYNTVLSGGILNNSSAGMAWLFTSYGNLIVNANVIASGNLTCSSLTTYSNTVVEGYLDVLNGISVSGAPSQFYTNTTMSANLTVNGTLNVTSAASYFYVVPPTGRLTLTSNVPVTTSDVTAATTLYYTPYQGNAVQIYNTVSSQWITYGFTQLSLSLSGFAGNNCFDIFIYNNSGTLTLIQIAWTNNTTRATALSRLNGIYVSSSNNGYLYLGTIYTPTGGQTQDAVSGRYVWNYYNRINRPINYYGEAGNWTYSGGTYRQANGNTAYLVQFAVGVLEDNFTASVNAYYAPSGTSGDKFIGLGLNNTTTPAGQNGAIGGSSIVVMIYANYTGLPSQLGYNYVAWLENASGGLMTVYAGGYGAGMQGYVMA